MHVDCHLTYVEYRLGECGGGDGVLRERRADGAERGDKDTLVGREQRRLPGRGHKDVGTGRSQHLDRMGILPSWDI